MTFRIAKLPDYRRMEVKPADHAWWFEQHERYRWTYARTMPHSPHFYIWRDKEMTKDDYDRMFGALRTFGTVGKYWDRTQLYLINPANGYRYWLMDRHYYTCTILNMATDGKTYGPQNAPRTRLGEEHVWAEYDAISPWWDDVYREFADYDSAALWKLVHHNVYVARPTLLDIGAGTGGTIDAKVAPSQHTTAVDPSQGMLNDLVLKYPQVGTVVPTAFADYLDSGQAHPHQLVVASLGSASYLSGAEVWGAFDLTKQMLVLSFYEAVPTHRTDLPATHTEALTAARALPGAREMVHGNFRHVAVLR